MECADFQRLVPASADGELAPAEEARLRQHSGDCPACAEALRRAEREVGLITSALRGEGRARPARRPPRALWAAAVVLVLALVAGFGLERTYRSAGDRAAASRARAFTAALEVPLRVKSHGVPLRAFLAEVSEHAGVPIALAEHALTRLGGEPSVSMDLRSPIRLRSVLGLLDEFYGLRPEITGAGFVLR